MTKQFDFDDADVKIVMPDGVKIAIFDVSRTIECLYIAISNGTYPHYLLEKLDDPASMAMWVAKKQIKGATVTDDGELLDYFANGIGFEDWKEYVADLQSEMERTEDPEFTTYYDAQGNEHAEY